MRESLENKKKDKKYLIIDSRKPLFKLITTTMVMNMY